jgi:hypothetical protein
VSSAFSSTSSSKRWSLHPRIRAFGRGIERPGVAERSKVAARSILCSLQIASRKGVDRGRVELVARGRGRLVGREPRCVPRLDVSDRWPVVCDCGQKIREIVELGARWAMRDHAVAHAIDHGEVVERRANGLDLGHRRRGTRREGSCHFAQENVLRGTAQPDAACIESHEQRNHIHVAHPLGERDQTHAARIVGARLVALQAVVVVRRESIAGQLCIDIGRELGRPTVGRTREAGRLHPFECERQPLAKSLLLVVDR